VELKLKLKIKDVEIELSKDEAKKLHGMLDSLMGEKVTYTPYPYWRPWTWYETTWGSTFTDTMTISDSVTAYLTTS
jgi:hypothetical protein